jgi:hypothetical protein
MADARSDGPATEFANEIVMTANFSGRIFNGIPPRCIEARRLKEGNKNLYCPEPRLTGHKVVQTQIEEFNE